METVGPPNVSPVCSVCVGCPEPVLLFPVVNIASLVGVLEDGDGVQFGSVLLDEYVK